MTMRMLLPLVFAALLGGFILMQLESRHITFVQRGPNATYLAEVRASQSTIVGGLADTPLLSLGHGMCDAITRTPDPQVAPRPVAGIGERDTRIVADAATRNLCPAARPKLTSYLTGDVR